MKALTVKNPYAWSIINGGKDVENRTQPTHYRGALYIHTAKRPDDAGLHDDVFLKAWAAAPKFARRELELQGYVTGTVDVTGCHPSTECVRAAADGGGHCSPWARPGHYHWTLANPRPLACPFPEQGKLGLWTLLENA